MMHMDGRQFQQMPRTGTHVYPVVLLYINALVCNDYNEVYEVLYCTVRLLYTIMYEDV